MKKLVHEPLVHFLLLGAALFGAYLALNRHEAESPQDIVITSGQIETLTVGFTKVWHRPPTQSELKGLIDGQVKEEIFSREAVKLGLDKNDTVIRRRLEQKMEFIAEDFAAARDPTDADLADYLAKHPERFVKEQRFTFRHVFLNREKRGDQLDADAVALLVRLRHNPAAADTSELGDGLLLPSEFNSEAKRDVVAQFGPEFTAALAKLKTGAWSGPIQSGYGSHLVLVTERVEGRLPPLDEVRDEVKIELMNARRLEANERFFASLLARYRVTIQPPRFAPAPAAGRVTMSQ